MCKPQNSLQSHYFVPRTCYIIAVMKVAFMCVVRCIFSLINATGENPINNKTAHITPGSLKLQRPISL